MANAIPFSFWNLFPFARHYKRAGQHGNDKRNHSGCCHRQSDDPFPADAFSASRLYRMMQHLSSSFSNSRKALASQGFPIPKRQALSPDSFSGFPVQLSVLWGACRQISGRIPRCRQHLLSKGSCPHPASLSAYPDRCSSLRC